MLTPSSEDGGRKLGGGALLKPSRSMPGECSHGHPAQQHIVTLAGAVHRRHAARPELGCARLSENAAAAT
jgi:hypothetical protein